MAIITPNTKKYLCEINSTKEWWSTIYYPADIVPISGIYRCAGCGKEITSNKDGVSTEFGENSTLRNFVY